MTLFFVFAFLILVIGIFLFLLFLKSKKELGSLSGKRIYEDTEEHPGVILMARSLPLYGKPDDLIHDADMLIPFENKTGKTPAKPYTNHIMQLIAYCILVQENYHIRPEYGVIKYPDKEFTIPFTEEYESLFRKIVKEMLYFKSHPNDFIVTSESNGICFSCRAELLKNQGSSL